MMQARIMAQYAAYQAVRAGSLNKGDCRKMQQAALVALLPTITHVDDAGDLAEQFRRRCSPCSAGGPGGKVSIHYAKGIDGRNQLGETKAREDAGKGVGQPIFEIFRERPTVAYVNSRPNNEDTDFDEPRNARNTIRLEIRMLYWYRLRIPFVDWVMSRMFLAYFGLQDYTAQSPIMPTSGKNWTDEGGQVDTHAWPGGDPGQNMKTWVNQGEYLFPIRVSAAMRMMTPPKGTYFKTQGCPL
jgi:hypothetical protein